MSTRTKQHRTITATDERTGRKVRVTPTDDRQWPVVIHEEHGPQCHARDAITDDEQDVIIYRFPPERDYYVLRGPITRWL